MIKINLATKKRALNAATGRNIESLRLDGAQLKAVLAQMQELPLKKIAVALGVAFAASFVLDSYKAEMIQAEQAEYDKIAAQKPKLEAEANKMKGLQELQKSMESDEKRIRTKLDTIKKLIAARAAAALVLEEVAKITPPNVWLSEFAMRGNELTFKGSSQDFGNISDFTRNIQGSAMFSDMTLKDTQMALDDQKRQVASFSLTARKR